VPAMLIDERRAGAVVGFRRGAALPPRKIIVSQPRRLAALGLVNRMKVVLGDDKVNIRSARDGLEWLNSPSDEICFMTTKDLITLLANNPYPHLPAFENLSHIIIDECHERGVESDVLVYLVRRLAVLKKATAMHGARGGATSLLAYPHFKVVLMSATRVHELYQEYFKGVCDVPCLFVGGGCYATKTVYLEDLPAEYVHEEGKESWKDFPNSILRARASRLQSLAIKNSEESHSVLVSQSVLDFQRHLTISLVRSLLLSDDDDKDEDSTRGVLIFASGQTDIEKLVDHLYQYGMDRLEIVPIYGKVELEDQEKAFTEAKAGKIKVIIATSLAQTSLTLPDVDLVIDFGTHRVMRKLRGPGNEGVLVPMWISQQSADQRGGGQ
jgi:HrpA-like RNA helicase